eukprot:492781-Amphidinium_carterae.1
MCQCYREVVEGTKLYLKHVVESELSECEGTCLVRYCSDTTPQVVRNFTHCHWQKSGRSVRNHAKQLSATISAVL